MKASSSSYDSGPFNNQKRRSSEWAGWHQLPCNLVSRIIHLIDAIDVLAQSVTDQAGFTTFFGNQTSGRTRLALGRLSFWRATRRLAPRLNFQRCLWISAAPTIHRNLLRYPIQKEHCPSKHRRCRKVCLATCISRPASWSGKPEAVKPQS